jgi:Zn-dependent M32 family carboxypeptidase
MRIRNRTAAAAAAALLGAGGLLAAAHAAALTNGGGPDRSAQIIQLSQDEFNAMTNEQLIGLHENLGRHNTATGTLDPDAAAAFVRISNALIAQTQEKP